MRQKESTAKLLYDREGNRMQKDLTKGNITKTLLAFAVPMILGNMLQQLYNIADTLIVGRFLGADALAAVGTAYSLMTFLTSIFIGLCMGSGSVFSICFGERDEKKLKERIFVSFLCIAAVAVCIEIVVTAAVDPILSLLQVPAELRGMMKEYLMVIFSGIIFTFLYNYFAFLLRAVGNSVTPLIFLAVSAILNIGLDLLLVVIFSRGVAGAAEATVISQAISGIGLAVYTLLREPSLRVGREQMRFSRVGIQEIAKYSVLTCIQQSVMNFGILMVQGLVNSFGTTVMAAFAAAVKIDTFAYMPAQEFGNAFSLFTAQNYGARQNERIRRGVRSAVRTAVIFCLVISAAVFAGAELLMKIFIDAGETGVIAAGAQYLRIEGAFYCGIGILFLMYGYFRAVNRPLMSVILTVISLGTRVGLAYLLAAIPAIGVLGIWWSIPIGWFLADLAGAIAYRRYLPAEKS